MCLFSGMNDLSTKRGHKKVPILAQWIEQIDKVDQLTAIQSLLIKLFYIHAMCV